MDKIKKIFSPMKSRGAVEKNKVIEIQKIPQVNICYRKINQVNFALGVRSYSLTDKRKYIVNVMSAFLGGMMSSRLYQKVVEKMGAAYYIASSNDSNVDTGNFAVWSGVEEGKFLDVIETILKEFRRLKKEKVGPEELRKAKDYIKGKMVLGLEDAESKASFYGTQELLTDRILSLKDILARIESVTAEDILEIANDIFCPEKLNLAIIGPFKNKKAFEKVLKI
jgi:predicted Zn-dependent peptidase